MIFEMAQSNRACNFGLSLGFSIFSFLNKYNNKAFNAVRAIFAYLDLFLVVYVNLKYNVYLTLFSLT
jgi:hypothetical protein